MECKKRRMNESETANDNDGTTTTNYFNKLPLELLTEILAYFKYKAEIQLLRLVCKRWLEAIESDHGLSLSKKSILEYSKIDSDADLSHTFRKFVNFKVRKDDQKDCFTRTKVIVSSLNLTHLHLDNFDTQEVLEILELAKSTLTSVSLVLNTDNKYTPKKHTPKTQYEFNKLKTLKISTSNEKSIPLNIIENFSNLECLDISLENANDQKALEILTTKSQKTLQDLKIHMGFGYLFSKKSNFGKRFDSLKRLERLVAIGLDFAIYSESNSESLFNNLPLSIESIDLKSVSFPEEILKSFHKSLPNLRILNIDDFQDNFDTLLQSPVFQFMKTLKAGHSGRFLNPTTMYQNSSLTSLTIDVDRMTKDRLSSLVQHLPSVNNLCLTTVQISSEFDYFQILLVISKWEKLKSLTLKRDSGKCRLTGDVITFPKLSTLNLRYCDYFFHYKKHINIPNVFKIGMEKCRWKDFNGKELEISDLEQIESLTWKQQHSSLPKLTHDFQNLKFFEVSIKIEDALAFIEKITSKNYTGTLILKDKIGSDYNEGQLLINWDKTIARIAKFVNLPFTKRRVHRNEEECYFEEAFDFKTDFIVLKVVFRKYDKDPDYVNCGSFTVF